MVLSYELRDLTNRQKQDQTISKSCMLGSLKLALGFIKLFKFIYLYRFDIDESISDQKVPTKHKTKIKPILRTKKR